MWNSEITKSIIKVYSEAIFSFSDEKENNEENKEIERKWLVDKNNIPFDLKDLQCIHIVQSYISFSPTIRLRKINDGEKFIMTIKSKGKKVNLVRDEYEFELTEKEYDHYIKYVKGNVVDKTRYIRVVDGQKYEIDIFNGTLEGLAYLEIEFKSLEEAESFKQPEWVTKEVTDDNRYTNASLAKTGKLP